MIDQPNDARRMPATHDETQSQPLTMEIHRALPQTQCQRCGYDDCLAYAQAVAQDGTPINRCPPGGQAGIDRLATVMQLPPTHGISLDLDCGDELPLHLAEIDENWCIGCTLCLDACPVDAIVGANKAMHTVLSQHCTGCELCVPVCPVDCIAMVPQNADVTGWAAWSDARAKRSLTRYEAHGSRMEVKKSGAQSGAQPGWQPGTEPAENGRNSTTAETGAEGALTNIAESITSGAQTTHSQAGIPASQRPSDAISTHLAQILARGKP